VRLLLELEPESDPVWHYLNVQNHRIHGMLEKCTFDHEARMEILRNQVHERALSDAKWRQIQQNGVQLVSSPVKAAILLRDKQDSGLKVLNFFTFFSILQSDDTSSMEDNQVQVDQPLEESARREKDALRGRYIKILTAVIVYHLPTFWKTALSVFTGKFAKVHDIR
jgi:exocyst complex component 2